MIGNSKNKKELTGEVVSSLMYKTIIVKVERRFPHPKYNKYIKKTKKYYAHDSLNKCNEGDIVTIQESKPISKNKKWIIKELVKEAVKI